MSRCTSVLACLAVVTAVAAAGPAAAEPVSGPWRARWAEDLRFAQQKVVEQHPNPFRTLDRTDWDAEFDRLVARLDSLEQHEAVVELARIVARLGDGHTRLTLPLGPGVDFEQGHSSTPDPKLPSLRFHQIPVRFSVEDDGLHVRRIAARHRRMLGGRVRAIGRRTVAQAMDAVAPAVHRDNPQQLAHHLPEFLALAEVLHARGVTARVDRVPLEVETPGGGRERAELAMVPFGEAIEWADAADASAGEDPLYLRHPERKFWLETVPDARTVYLQFNEVYDEPDETLRDFAERVGRRLAEPGAENLVIDLRANRGGNFRLTQPLLHTILCSPVNRHGHLFVLTGRATFSAAMLFALELERHTRALFAGEPTGARANHYGDARKITLPNTGLTLRVSTLFWQNDPNDDRDALAPTIPVALTTADVRAGRDPVLDTVLGIVRARAAGSGRARGAWSGTCGATAATGFQALPMRIEVRDGPAGVTLHLPDLGLDGEATGVSVEGAEAGFTAALDGTPVRFRGTACGDWLVGEAGYRSYTIPFVLRAGR